MAEWTSEELEILRKGVKDFPREWVQVARELQLAGFHKSPDACRKKAKRLKLVKKIKRKERNEPPEIVGITADQELDIDRIWQAAYRVQERHQSRTAQRDSQAITLPAIPVGIAFLSDMHFGSRETDYMSARMDAQIIRDTDGLHCGYHGDGYDNWIVGKLEALQRGQGLQYDEEIALFSDYLTQLNGKLLFAVSGNHEGWTYALTGLDVVRDLIKTTKALYDPDEVVFTLRVGEAEWVMKVRHKWKWSSIFNPTHPQEVSWQRGDIDFDIGLGGHTHIGTLLRPFIRHNKKRYAILTGTYKTGDKYSRQLGFAKPHGTGSGAMIFYPDGRTAFFEDLSTAAEFLTWLRANW